MSTSAGAITLDLTLNSKIEEQLKKLTKGIADKFSGSVEEINGRLEKSIQKPFESMQKASEKANKSIAKPFESAKKASEKAAKGVKDTFENTFSDVENAVSKCMARMETEQKKFTETAAKSTDINTNSKAEVSAPKKSAMASPVPSMDELDKYVGKATEKTEKLSESFRAATNPVELLNQKLDVTYAKIGDAQREADELFAKYNQIANAKGADSNEAMSADKAFTAAQDKLIRLQESVSRTEGKLNQAVTKAGQTVNSTATQAGNTVKKTSASAGNAIKSNLENPVKRVNSRFSKIKSTILGVGSAGKSAFSKLRSHLKSTDKSTRNTNGLFSKLGKTVKGVFKATFITAALYGAFRGLKSLFSDAMSQSKEFQKSLNNLKANFKIAFQPVISTVLPILTKLMNALSQVMAKVASFISGVFGTTYDKSKQAAKQASQTAKKSSEEAEKYLNSYDVMNKAQDTSKDKSDSEDDGVDFDAVDTKGSKAAEKLGAKFKKIMSELFAPIKDAWSKHGQPVMDSIKTTAGKIKKLFVDIGKDFKDVWTDGTGERYVSSILNLVRSIVTTVGKIAGAFDKAWNKCGAGKELIQSIFDSATKVNDLFADISDSIGKAFDSPAGVQFFSNILSIVSLIVSLFFSTALIQTVQTFRAYISCCRKSVDK